MPKNPTARSVLILKMSQTQAYAKKCYMLLVQPIDRAVRDYRDIQVQQAALTSANRSVCLTAVGHVADEPSPTYRLGNQPTVRTFTSTETTPFDRRTSKDRNASRRRQRSKNRVECSNRNNCTYTGQKQSMYLTTTSLNKSCLFMMDEQLALISLVCMAPTSFIDFTDWDFRVPTDGFSGAVFVFCVWDVCACLRQMKC